MITIEFTVDINNDSLQVGDNAYFVSNPSNTALGGFDQSTNQPTLIGPITAIDINNNIIVVDDNGLDIPSSDDFIMFEKDSSINLSGLVGYYAEVKISNNSTERAEMFGISSEISVSSK